MGSAAVVSAANRHSGYAIPIREITLRSLNAITQARAGLSAGLGAGIATALLRIGIKPLTSDVGITPSQFNMEFGESLRRCLQTI